jgi:hypothetical protein
MNLKAKLSAIPMQIGSLFRGLYGRIARLRSQHAIMFIIASFGLGQAINRCNPLDRFLVYQLLFIPAIVIAFAEVKAFVLDVERYKAMIASHPIRETGSYISNLLESYWAIPGVIVISSLYIYSTVSLKYIAMNSTGYYAMVMIALVMVSAMLGQTCYVYYLLLLWRVSRSETFKYSFYFPARTDWVQLLTKIGARLSNAFFVLGFIYTTVFFLNVPRGYMTISLNPWQLKISTPNDFAFIAGWATIFIIIIFAFPFYAWVKARFLKAIIRRLKDISLGEIEMLVTESNIRGKGNIDAELKYYQLMANIESSSSEAAHTDKLIPIALTLSSIAVHLIKISESFAP